MFVWPLAFSSKLMVPPSGALKIDQVFATERRDCWMRNVCGLPIQGSSDSEGESPKRKTSKKKE